MKLVGRWWRLKNLNLSSLSGSAGNLQVCKYKLLTKRKLHKRKPLDEVWKIDDIVVLVTSRKSRMTIK
jgi:hypothetical protein